MTIAIELAERSAGFRFCRSTACRSIADSTSEPPSRLQPSKQRSAHQMIDLVEPDNEYSVAEFQTRSSPAARAGGRGADRGRLGSAFPLDCRSARISSDRSLELRAELEALEDPVVSNWSVPIPAPASSSISPIPDGSSELLKILQLTGLTPTARSTNRRARRQFDEYVPFYEFTAVGIDPGPLLRSGFDSGSRQCGNAGWWEEVEATSGDRSVARRAGQSDTASCVRRRQDCAIQKQSGTTLRSDPERLAQTPANLFSARPPNSLDWLEPRWTTSRTRMSRTALGL